ncbi:pentatricopeptide repeat-containing protein At4g02820, mitochondrial isoform X2 [Jatropha curcas]|uniref:pentatricopeptide repeat-containing protein At4g02820, mitochondrial isoform X2 n=1 Tax=Jatropha curcas TaxID=180498 RepID=UPI0005FB4638|nr:pentatricopeptide repeat-containing protein At4g02820, mitochondrial isoform X2 [Jatropha curcas]
MLLRSIRRNLAAAARHFSGQAAATVSERPVNSGREVTRKGGGGDTLGRRLFSLAYAKRSAVIAIQKWKSEGHSVQKYQLNRIVRELRKLKRYKHALEVCEWMTQEREIKLLPGDYAVHLDLIAKFEKIPGIIKELKKNTSPDVVTYNLWLRVCASQNDIKTAKEVLLELKKAKIDPDWITYSTLSNLYIKNELLEDAASTLKEMEKRAWRKNRLAYSSLLSLHTSMGNKDGLHRIWNKMKSLFRKMNDAEYICMISSLVKLEEIEKAEKLYSEWESVSGTCDPQVSNILLAAYINRNRMEEAEKFQQRMVQKGIRPCYTTWELLTWGHLKDKQMENVLDYFKKAISSVKKWSLDKRLVGEIFKNLEERGDVEGAEEFLVMLRNAGHVSTEIYNSLLRTYAKAGVMPLIIAERMGKDNVELNEETHRLIQTTSNMCVSEVSSFVS